MKTKFFITKVNLIGIIILQLILCILIGTQKKSLFCDETYSYGLANSEKYTFIDPETAKKYSDTGWVKREYFEDYLEISREVPFSFKAAFENQKRDVHPPLYYCVLHLFCLLNNGNFTKWTGLALNFVMLILIDAAMIYISNYFLKDKRMSIVAVFLWTFSAAGLSNILLIRMYMMLTFEMLAYVAIHIKMLEKQKIEIFDILGISILVVCGGLTHYYFYLFAVCFSMPVCIYFILDKKLYKMFTYAISICVGAGIALCVFPDTLMHIFHGYRGNEVIENLTHGSRDKIIETYLQMIDNSMFGGKLNLCLCLLLLLALINIIIKYFVKIEYAYNQETKHISVKFTKKNNINYGEIQITLKNEMLMGFLIAFSYGMYFFIAIKGSNIIHNRYIYPVYPIVALAVIGIINGLIKKFVHSLKLKILILSIVSIMMCVGSVFSYGIDFMYFDYDAIYQQALETSGTDCLFYYGDGWFDVYTNFPLRFLHDETYIMRSQDINHIEEILSRRESEDNLVVCLPAAYSDEDTYNILNAVTEQAGRQNYRMIYKYHYVQEWRIE